MTRIPPSQKIREAVQQLLGGGLSEDGDITSKLLRLGAQRLAQELLEQEVVDFLGRGHYERRDDDVPHRGYRNRYKPGRIRSAEGAIPMEIPQVRNTSEPFESRLIQFLRGNSDVLERLVAEMYARGLSTRDIEDALRDGTGTALISRTGVSQVTEALWEEYEAFRQRDLAGLEVEYLFLDAVYEALRRQAPVREGVLCAWAILNDERKVLVHMGLGNKESHNCWLEFLRDMLRRGLRQPLTVTTDGAPGLLRAVREVWPDSLRIRCWVHKMRHVSEKLPECARQEVKPFLFAVRDAPTHAAGQQAAADVLELFGRKYPSAMASFSEDLEASLAHLQVPAIHRQFVRTTNLIERSFVEERRRTKVIPQFLDERSCLKLVFATLARASHCWQRVRFSEVERKQLALLRARLLEEPAAKQESRSQDRSTSVA